MKKLLLLATICFSLNASAQINLKGNVYDEKSTLITGATIRLIDSDCSATSGFSGEFSFRCPSTSPQSPIVLEISHEGIKGVYKKFKPIEIVLTEELNYYKNKMIRIEVVKRKKCIIKIEDE